MQTIITVGTKSRLAPQHWNDLPLKQLLHIFRILTTIDAQALIATQRIALLKILLQLDDKDFHGWRRNRRSTYGRKHGDTVFFAELNEVLHATTNFLFDRIEQDGETLYEPKPALTRCPYPIIQGKAEDGNPITLHAPADALSNLTFYELTAVFTHYENYIQTRDPEEALRLLATIYRPAKPASEENLANNYEGDMRQPFRRYESTVAQRMPYLQAVPAIVRGLLIFWVGCCRTAVIEQYLNLFDSGEGNQRNAGNDYGWAGVLLNLAGGPIHLNAIADQNFHNAFIWMSMQEDARKVEEFRANAAKLASK